VAPGLATPARALKTALSVCRVGTGHRPLMLFILWLIAVVLVIAGIFQLFKGQMLWGIVLIIVGLLVGPGGYSVFS
jgi:hypothetical protein